MKLKKTKDSYYQIKQICKDLKENNLKKRVKEEGRFEDVPVEVSDRDRYGYVKLNSYYDFFQTQLFVPDKNDNLQPAGMSSTHKDYI